MKKSKPTKGPLTIRKKDQFEVYIDKRSFDKSTGHSSWEGLAVFFGPEDSPDCRVAEANARLFVEANEMKRILKKVLKWWNTGEGENLNFPEQEIIDCLNRIKGE